MKTIVLTIALALGFVVSTPVFAAAEIKEVCKDRKDKAGKVVVDKKTNKPAQDCKKIRIHKKLEGTPVPEKK